MLYHNHSSDLAICAGLCNLDCFVLHDGFDGLCTLSEDMEFITCVVYLLCVCAASWSLLACYYAQAVQHLTLDNYMSWMADACYFNLGREMGPKLTLESTPARILHHRGG
ncbi:hypothetical protein KC19_3G107700 [Ceratodon purpureus]|uniref:Uncharacterized protein n=1 Tax=Ceratodon purpureus TaxID=3225 RepID=A0A8T0IH59_CERPU|nr:hypothetical protein KC19_3G107700 [Ceratodon purpureus]